MPNWFNTQKSVYVIHYINKGENMIILADADKAFDKMQCPITLKALSEFT